MFHVPCACLLALHEAKLTCFNIHISALGTPATQPSTAPQPPADPAYSEEQERWAQELENTTWCC